MRSVTVQANALPPAKRPGVMGAIKGNIGAVAAKSGNDDDEKIAINPKDVAKTWCSPLNAGAKRFFSSQRRGSEEDARSSGLAEKDFTFYANRFT